MTGVRSITKTTNRTKTTKEAAGVLSGSPVPVFFFVSFVDFVPETYVTA